MGRDTTIFTNQTALAKGVGLLVAELVGLGVVVVEDLSLGVTGLKVLVGVGVLEVLGCGVIEVLALAEVAVLGVWVVVVEVLGCGVVEVLVLADVKVVGAAAVVFGTISVVLGVECAAVAGAVGVVVVPGVVPLQPKVVGEPSDSHEYLHGLATSDVAVIWPAHDASLLVK